MAVQLVHPQLNVKEKAGLCLQFTRRVFGAPIVEDTAWEAWEKAINRHTDRNFPKGVSVPIFFDWSGNILWSDGEWRWGRYGHAAVLLANGKIRSSPLTGEGYVEFNSIEELEQAFGNGMKYVGWAEGISGVRVIKKEDNMNDTQAHDLGTAAFRALLHMEPPTVEEARELGRKFEKNKVFTKDSIEAGFNFVRKKTDNWAAQDKKIKAKPGTNEKITVLAKGKYEVK